MWVVFHENARKFKSRQRRKHQQFHGKLGCKPRVPLTMGWEMPENELLFETESLGQNRGKTTPRLLCSAKCSDSNAGGMTISPMSWNSSCQVAKRRWDNVGFLNHVLAPTCLEPRAPKIAMANHRDFLSQTSLLPAKPHLGLYFPRKNAKIIAIAGDFSTRLYPKNLLRLFFRNSLARQKIT